MCRTDGQHAEHWHSYAIQQPISLWLTHLNNNDFIKQKLSLSQGKDNWIRHWGYRYLVERMKCNTKKCFVLILSVTLRASKTHNRKTKSHLKPSYLAFALSKVYFSVTKTLWRLYVQYGYKNGVCFSLQVKSWQIIENRCGTLPF